MEKSPPKWHRLPTDSHLLLYRFDWESDNYTLYVTDLQNVYVELLSYKQIIKRAFHYNTVGTAGIEPQANLSEFYLLLERLETGLTIPNTTRVVNAGTSRSTSRGLRLELEVKFPPSDQYAPESQSQRLFIPNPVLSWHFMAQPLPSNDPLHVMAFQTLLVGLLGIIDAQRNQIDDLCTLLKKKDFHLRHLKAETGATSEPAIHKDAYRPFERAPWIARWIIDRVKGEEDIVNIVRRLFTTTADMLWGYHARGRIWTDKDGRLIKLSNVKLLEQKEKLITDDDKNGDNDTDESTDSESNMGSIPKLIRRNSVLSSLLQSPKKPRLAPAMESALKRELESDQPPPLTFKRPCLESNASASMLSEPTSVVKNSAELVDDDIESKADVADNQISNSSNSSVVKSHASVASTKRRPKRRF